MPLIRPLNGTTPQIGQDVFLAENAVIIGEVTLADRSSVWYNVTIRGDVNRIEIGEESNIQDGTVVHCTYQKAATTIGKRVTVGHSAVIHGCTLEDDCLVGMGSIVMDGAVVQSDVIVAAGSLVREGQILESGYLYAGVPARQVKPLSQAQIDGIRQYARYYVMYAGWYMNDAPPPTPPSQTLDELAGS
jgi:carbonic anhydrase/acetyltransferase-like protein (isoleucine patch superfamily)